MYMELLLIISACGFFASTGWIAVYGKPRPVVQTDWAGNTKHE